MGTIKRFWVHRDTLEFITDGVRPPPEFESVAYPVYDDPDTYRERHEALVGWDEPGTAAPPPVPSDPLPDGAADGEDDPELEALGLSSETAELLAGMTLADVIYLADEGRLREIDGIGARREKEILDALLAGEPS